jgi:hypothetical protein
VAQSSHVLITLHGIDGRQVEILLNEDLQEGDHTLSINTTHLAHGTYFVSIITNYRTVNEKLVVE